ncbi:rhodanese-like domain-containing protein 8, chloroplastic isoform X2 [Mangifera indica]|uniref:rhodanese-like domain-containing protein 8, chloroplastic isoform X2 n=1 Tax=Mangifera indica TaxID=29780 RepID=UPI001CFA2CAE|nr:rhodanese-like domain-containing protein 8, chloroplastic isoform X2 [Mangifera indica]
MMRGHYQALHSLILLPPPIFSIPTTIHTNLKPFLKQQLTAHFRVACCSASLLQSQPPRETSASVNKNNNRRRRAKSHGNNDDDNGDFLVVNFYKFVFVKDPEVEVAKHLAFLEDLNIHGRIYLNEQGINAQYSGPSKDALSYVEWLKKDEQFSDILVQISPALNGHAFPKLKLRYKPSLVQLEGGISHLPLLDPSMRATPLEPSEWRKRLEAVKDGDEASNSNLNSNLILLDVRNGYEWDIGHFDGAKRPDVDCFRSTSFGQSQSEALASDPLAKVDKEKTDILMYCTGGIRCDVYSTILRQRGFQNLYTLKGGVSHYLKNEGSVEWVGNLFVFDSRLSLPPAAYRPGAMTQASKIGQVFENLFATCYICDSQISELRHRNCANLDCNLLFLCCSGCVKTLQGCCCLNCTTAPRLRPVLPGHERYQKWHVYRDSELQTS